MTVSAAVELLVFKLAGQRFGISLNAVREVVRAVSITPLPGAPMVVEGVIDLRGRVVPVYDLRARFGLPPRSLDPGQQFILARAGERIVAVRVDNVVWLFTVPAEEVEEAVRISSSLPRIAGVARLPDGLVLIHDIETFLTAAESVSLEDALAAAESAGTEDR